MFSQRFPSCVVPVLTLMFLVQFVQTACAQQSGLQSPPSRYYFTVIGAVGVPGVYEYSSGLPLLVDVIHSADGLTSEASGTFRIVREGKVSRQMFYSPDSRMLLLSGDIVILDRSLSGTGGAGRTATAFESQSLVQIVAVNLIHRPVVMKLRSEDATLEQIVILLNQSPRVIPTVKILQAKTSEYLGPGKASAKFRLNPESVLIFDSSVVRIDQIPKLPPVYKPKVRTASFQQIRGPSSEETLGNYPKSVVIPASGSSLRGESSQIDQAEKMLWVPSSFEQARPPKAKPAYEIPPFWTSINREEPSTTPQAESGKIAPDSQPALPPADPLVYLPDEKGTTESAEKSTVTADNSEIIILLRSMAKQGLIAVGFVGLLGAGWFISRKLRQRVKPQYNFQPVKKKTAGILDALIENKLSLVEESFIFPEGLELQVPAVLAVSRKSFRVDSSHQILRPILPSVVEEPVPDSSRSVTKTTQIDAISETPLVESGLIEPVEMLQHISDVPLSEALPESVETQSEIYQTRFPETEPYTEYVYPTTWPEPASVSDPAVEITSETASRNESASISSEQTNRIDSPQTRSQRPRAHSSGWVLDRVLVALQGVTRQ